MNMINFAVYLAVGPSQQELERTADLLDSLWTYEPYTPWLVFIDDSTQDRQLTKYFRFPDTCKAVSVINPRQGKGIGHTGGLNTATLSALQWINKHTDTSFTLKLDTDALVIAPFAEKIARAFAAMPNVGILGSYKKTCNGDLRDFSDWAKYFRHLSSPMSIFRVGRKIYFHLGFWGKSALVRRHINSALKNGYEPGEHCQGGAYAVSSKLISQMAINGYLEDPLLWLHTPVGEDSMMGMYVKATNMQLYGLVEQDQPFAVKYAGLADTPENLLSRGYSLIHSIKNDKKLSEQEIRDFYRKHRSNASKK